MSKKSEFVKNILRASVPRVLRSSLRSPSTSAKWFWDSIQFSLGITKALNFPSGRSIICHPHAYHIFCAAQIDDPDQREEFRNFETHCSDRMMLFDIGAHYGVFSLAAALYGGNAIAVDPSPMATQMIAIEIALNSCSDTVRVVQAAVSDINGVLNMLNSGIFSAGYFKVTKSRSRRDLTKTQALTIDQMVDSFGVPTHIKIDVEGHEAAVLRGAKDTLCQHSPDLFLELHNEMILADGGDPASSLDELAMVGYETYTFDGEVLSRHSILKKPIVRCVASKRNGR
jgi:FkbM family methyltransferase